MAHLSPALPDRQRLWLWLASLVLAVGTRVIALGRWPGINGDEAWYGVNVQELLSGGAVFLHTGVGNPLNPLHSGLLLALSTVFTSSLVLLRVPEVLFGIAAVALAYPLLRKPLGDSAALAATLLLAVSPTAVAYSRLGWDPSGTPLITLIAIACALRDRPVVAMITVAVGCLVHPTNIFVSPMVVAAWMPHAATRYQAMDNTARRRAQLIGLAVMLAGILIASFVLSRAAANPETTLPPLRSALERMVSPVTWLDRLSGVVALVSGTTVVQAISAPLGIAIEHSVNIAVAVTIVAAIVLGWLQLRSTKTSLWLLGGLMVSLAGFHVVAFPHALQPGFERYGLFLLSPAIIAIAVVIDAVAVARPRLAATFLLAIISASLSVLIGGYFYPLAKIGGASVPTYRTGFVEPKAAAFAFIETDSQGQPVKVVAQEWFLYWTLRYLAGPESRIHVEPEPGAAIPGGIAPAGALARSFPSPSRTYYVRFAGSAPPVGAYPVFAASDPLGRPIVNVFATPSTPK